MSFWTGAGAGLLSGGLDLLGGIGGGALEYQYAKKLLYKQQQFAKEMYQHRYRYTMRDMQKAGLNPILAYQQGGGSAPSAAGVGTPHVKTDRIGSSAVAAMRAAKEMDLLDAQAQQSRTQSNVNLANVDALFAQASNAMAAAGEHGAKTAYWGRMIKNLRQEFDAKKGLAEQGKIAGDVWSSDVGWYIKVLEIVLRTLSGAKGAGQNLMPSIPLPKGK